MPEVRKKRAAPKGRAEFTQAEIAEIRRLVQQLSEASASRRKHIRQQMRDLGFHISDFGGHEAGFREADLDRLLTRGQISVSDLSDQPARWKRMVRRFTS